MKKIILPFLFSLCFVSCKDKCIEPLGDSLTKTIKIDSLVGVNVLGSIDVFFTQGPEQEIKATGMENIIDALKTQVVNGIWNIDLEEGCYDNFNLRLNIVLPDLKAVEIDGSGDVEVNDFTNQESLDVEINGSGNVVLNSFGGASRLGVYINGSGELEARSVFEEVENVLVEINGSGDVFLYPITSPNVEVNIEGSGDCSVRAEDLLKVTINGSGNVKYKGSPVIEQSINGSGDLINDN